ncbi:hypothetical protein [Actinomadura sp. 3N508]|uniref:hypothetical protein n=1 Tax=Actinomadura sp. 3N508 TaxID=3375153 RepID=UPI0037A4B922
MTDAPTSVGKAHPMLTEALQAEVDAYVARFAEERNERGRRLVVLVRSGAQFKNGKLVERPDGIAA